MHRHSTRHSLLIALIWLAVSGQVTAQTTAASSPSSAPPSFSSAPASSPAQAALEQSRMKSADLKPHAPRLMTTSIEQLPLKEIQLPAGFKLEVWAHGIPGARMMARGERGTVFVGSRIIGRVYAVSDKGDRRESRILAEKLVQPNGIAIRDGNLYVAAINKVLRYDNIETVLQGNPESLPQPLDMTDKFGLPPEQHHGWKFLAFGPDGKLYIPVGIPCNACEINPAVHGNIRRYNADGSGMQIMARGVRNSVGFDFHPKTGELWFTDNGRDWQGEDGPQDELNRLPSSMIGASFGNPYCHADGKPDLDIQKPNACAGTIAPATLMGAHAAALGMRFYTGKMFPAEYQNSIFVARRGSWNKTEKNGYDVVNVRTSADGKQVKVLPFLSGLLDRKGNRFLGRPVDVLPMPDGALLVSDEENGAIYRISYSK